MNMDNYTLRLMTEEDIPAVVALLNHNKVYQIHPDKEITIDDFLLTCAIKEISHFFVLNYQNKIVGTTAFYKYIVFGVAQHDQYYSGFLLIDAAHRSGKAISTLNHQLFYEALKLDYGTQLTEINLYNKASLNLSKKNGFILTDDSYEDIDNCILLKSPLIKLLKAHKKMSVKGKKYDVTTFRLLEQIYRGSHFYTTFEVSGSSVRYKITDVDRFPYSVDSDDFKIAIVKQKNKMYVEYDIKQKNISEMKVISSKHHSKTVLNPERGQVSLGKKHKSSRVEIQLACKEGKRTLFLEKNDDALTKESDKIVLFDNYKGLSVLFNKQNGATEFYLKETKLFEDTFITANFNEPLLFSVELNKNYFVVTGRNRAIKWVKTCYLDKGLNVTYTLKQYESTLNDVTVKFGLKIEHQDYWVWEEEQQLFHKFISNTYPLESADFLSVCLFNAKKKRYYIERLEAQLMVSSTKDSSNQFQMRPMFYSTIRDFNMERYTIHIGERGVTKDSDFYRIDHTDPVSKNKRKHYPINYLEAYPSDASNVVKKNLTKQTKQLIDVSYKQYETYDEITWLLKRKDIMYMNYMRYNQIAIDVDFYVVGKLKLNMSQQYAYWRDLDNHSCKYEFYERVTLFDTQRQQYVTIELPNSYLYVSREKHLLKIRGLVSKEHEYPIKIIYGESRNGYEKHV